MAKGTVGNSDKLITGGMDNAAFIVDSVTGAQLNKLAGHTKKVTAVGCYQGME
jgi:hypothetical protein